jgi:hypothetical protein
MREEKMPAYDERCGRDCEVCEGAPPADSRHVHDVNADNENGTDGAQGVPDVATHRAVLRQP